MIIYSAGWLAPTPCKPPLTLTLTLTLQDLDMGGCVSSAASTTTDSHSTSAAKLISLHGELREYFAPVTVSQVLPLDSPSSCFVCNSDCLYYDDYIPAMNPDDQLLPGQIYFLLSATKLQHRLTASDMAALAVKATIALQNHSKKSRRGRHNHKSRISPLSEVNLQRESSDAKDGPGMRKSTFDKPALGVSSRPPSASVRKLHRYSSRRARMAVRSFRLRLTTIYEGSVLYV